MMLSTANLLSPSNGEPVVGPTQDMVLGCYYLTIEEEQTQGKAALARFSRRAGAACSPTTSARSTRAHDVGTTNHAVPHLALHSPVEVTVKAWDEAAGEITDQTIRTTVGRVIFNQALPDRLRFTNKTMNRTALRELVAECYRLLGPTETAHLVDGIKSVGFHYATRGGMTISVDDIAIPAAKPALLKAGRRAGRGDRQAVPAWPDHRRRALRAGRRRVEEDHPDHLRPDDGGARSDGRRDHDDRQRCPR